MKIFARWRARRKARRDKQLTEAVFLKLCEAAVMALEDGCRFQVISEAVAAEGGIQRMVTVVSKGLGTHVRASAAHGLVTLYVDDGESEGLEVVIATIG